MSDVMEGRISEQEQIARAAELGIGTAAASAIHLVTLDKTAESVADRILVQLDADR